MLKKAKDFKIRDRVEHKIHGKGTVYAYSRFDEEIFIDFDIKPDGWDKILGVSPHLLKKI